MDRLRPPPTSSPRRIAGPAGFGLALIGLLSLGPVQAQQAVPATPSQDALCATEDALLSVSVGGQGRGDFLVKVTPGGVYLEAAALQDAESKYGLSTLACDGLNYRLINPALNPSYDPLGQTLGLTPVLDLLPGNTLDFRGARTVAPVPTQAAYGVDGGLRATATTSGDLSAQTYLGVAYFGGALSAYTGLGASIGSIRAAAGDRSTSGDFGVRAIVHFDINTDWGVSAAYRVDTDSVGGLGYGVGSFTGLSINTRGGLKRELARVELDLPLEANVVVRVGERTLRQFRAAPGKLVLLNIPLENIVGTVEVNVSDSNGTRTFASPYSFGGGSLKPGAYLATARVGVLGNPFGVGGRRTLEVNGRVGFVNDWSLQASARLQGDDYDGSVQARHSSSQDSLGVGATVSGSVTPDPSGVRAAPDLRLNADYARQIGILGLSATATVPVSNPGASQIGLGLGYLSGRWAATLNGGYDLGQQQLNASLGAGYTFDDARQLSATLGGGYTLSQQAWNATLSASYTPNDAQTFTGFVSATPGRVQAGVGLRYTPNDRLSVDAGANVGRASAVSATGPASTQPVTTVGGTLAASYQIAPGQAVRASTDFQSLNASYEDSRTLYTAGTASLTRTDSGVSGSATAEVRGAVALLGGHAVLGQSLGQRAVVVRTGTPNIPLLLNGARVAVTDARGEALLTGLPEGSLSQVAVNLDALPFNITARDATADVSLAQSGVYILDWSHNFDVSRWVRVFWSPSEASVYGVLVIGTQRYPLDDQGYVLIPDTRGPQQGTLRSDDGTRTCQLSIPADGDRAVCPAQPPQNVVGSLPAVSAAP